VWWFDEHDGDDFHGCNRYHQCKHGHESERNDHYWLDTYVRLDVFATRDDCNSVAVVLDDYSVVNDYDEDTLANRDPDPNGNPVACGDSIDTDSDVVEH
jgi:hypothetical protein